MYVRDIYDTVITISPMKQPLFFTYLDTAVNGLKGRYGEKFVFIIPAYIKPNVLDSEIPVHEEYRNAIVYNIIFLATKDKEYKQLADEESHTAYKNVWRDKAKYLHFYDTGEYYNDYNWKGSEDNV